MILTVTPNSALDRVLFIDEFRPGVTNRPYKMVLSGGGKALDASIVLQTMGVPNVALSFVAGSTGRQLVEMMDRHGITHDMIWVEGETRTANVLVETKFRRHSHIIAGSVTIPLAAYQELLARYRSYLGRAVWVATGGSVPEGMPVTAFREMTELAQAQNVPVLIDSSGPPVLAALPIRPAILKMNQEEFAQTFDLAAGSLDELIDQALDVRERYDLPALVLTLGSAGIVALTASGSYRAVAPPQLVVNAAGAGDGASAALVWRLSLGESWPETLRWAAAIAAAVVITEGTAECHPEDVQRLLPQVEVMKINK